MPVPTLERRTPLSLAEEAYLALAMQIRDDAIQRAKAEFDARIRVFGEQYGVAPDTTLVFEPRHGPIPAMAVYAVPEVPSDLGDKASATPEVPSSPSL